ncbi:hypothetical protein [Neorhizobium galegae]|uniref:hypothetical protein n=1 Tax=Neorhizobium galegae TaxID=399 RepID=UPI000621D13F|nr:hypothetical protein [Neorhizobium galegae]KAB1122017.1 hypothetical protein F4V90_22745 [Neorhizobium galegae]MCQ1809464.1 hypothetical protein [Neorhizobium galegae]CDZ64046.1 Hypothetical protein NGAL_HAMBI2566_58730 [Neorhizobium galegae bv. orientalis]
MVLNPADGYPHTPYNYAEYAGNRDQQAEQYILDIDSAMRASYAPNIYNIGRNIFPILYAESTFDGGRYTLVKDAHSSYTYQNVAAVYDQVKAICHIPLGIFSIVSAYFEYPANKQWQPALQDYLGKIQLVRDNLDRILPDAITRAACREILNGSLTYIQTIMGTGTPSADNFATYARALTSAIAHCQEQAAKNQVAVMTSVLNGWKAMLGEEEWDKMYVVVSAIWTLSQESAHELIIKATMKPERRETHVIVSEAVPTLDDAKTLLGRIVGDRIMSELVFDPNGGKVGKENIYSLSTRRDLLSQAIETIVGDVASGPVVATSGCPHMD